MLIYKLKPYPKTFERSRPLNEALDEIEAVHQYNVRQIAKEAAVVSYCIAALTVGMVAGIFVAHFVFHLLN